MNDMVAMHAERVSMPGRKLRPAAGAGGDPATIFRLRRAGDS